jgi:precorrin-6A/cobalt-precorrin-6A reductase
VIWVIGGTEKSRLLIERLLASGYQVLATTVTAYGASLLSGDENLTVRQGAIDAANMMKLVDEYRIRLIVDASHPYAEEVKRNVAYVSVEKEIPLLELGRQPVEVPGAVYCKNYIAAAEYVKEKEGNILLAIGSRNLKYFRETGCQKIFARVLPLQQSIAQCTEAGFTPDRIIAMQYTASVAFEMALMQELSVRYMITKESGAEGGLPEKADAAKQLGVEVIVIQRPARSDAELFFDIDALLTRTEEILHG